MNLSRIDARRWAASSASLSGTADNAETATNQAWLEQVLFRICVLYALWRGY